MRGLWALVVLVALAGCTTPPAFTIASFVLDGVSYLATGKSVNDHALSIVVQQDCAMWRVLKERDLKAICHNDDTTVVVADATPPPAADLLKLGDDRMLASSWAAADPGADALSPEAAAWDAVVLDPDANAPSAADLLNLGDDRMLASSWVAAADPRTVALSPEVAAWDAVVLEPAADAPPAFAAVSWSPTNRTATYLVAGNFRHLGRAERLIESLGGYPATIKSAVVGERQYYRVLAGPYSGDELAAARKRLTISGVGQSWAISLCAADLGPPPCAPPPPTRLPKPYGLSAD